MSMMPEGGSLRVSHVDCWLFIEDLFIYN